MDHLSATSHPGTISGFADAICHDLEKYVNILLDQDYNASHPNAKVVLHHPHHNSLKKKLDFLVGNRTKILFENEPNPRHVQLDQKIISSDLFDYLDSVRDARNRHTHDIASVYSFLAGFRELRIDLGNGRCCRFLPYNNAGTIQIGESKPYDGCVGSILFQRAACLSFLASSNHLRYDLKMTLFTKIKSPVLISRTHVLIVWWGNTQFSFPVDQYALGLLREFLVFRPEDKETCYFALDPTKTLLKIVHGDFT